MQAWETFVDILETEIGSETVQKWVRPLKILRFDACNIYLEANDPFQMMWFEEHLRQKVQTRFFNNNRRRIKVHLSVANLPNKPKNRSEQTSKDQVNQPKFTLAFDELDPDCTFSSFVVSEPNVFTYQVFSRIAGILEQEDINTNPIDLASLTPLYVSGPAGSGKTHLLMAAAHALRKQGLHVLYARAQLFADHVVSAIRAGEMRAFRQAYRNIDVLMIDDVHIFSRKGATQEEFFHTFNTLHMAGKQLIISANCVPAELQFIEPRLISRFEWGISLSLDIPPKDKRVQILLEKSKLMKFPLHSKVVEFLIHSFPNPKMLSKALEALVLRSYLNQEIKNLPSNQLSVLQTKHILEDLLQEQQEMALTPPRILQYVSEYFGIRPEDIVSKGQSKSCVLPRQIAMHFCRHELKLPFLKIGQLFARDHSTVMSSVKLVQKGLEKRDEEMTVPILAIMKKIKA